MGVGTVSYSLIHPHNGREMEQGCKANELLLFVYSNASRGPPTVISTQSYADNVVFQGNAPRALNERFQALFLSSLTPDIVDSSMSGINRHQVPVILVHFSRQKPGRA